MKNPERPLHDLLILDLRCPGIIECSLVLYKGLEYTKLRHKRIEQTTGSGISRPLCWLIGSPPMRRQDFYRANCWWKVNYRRGWTKYDRMWRRRWEKPKSIRKSSAVYSIIIISQSSGKGIWSGQETIAKAASGFQPKWSLVKERWIQNPDQGLKRFASKITVYLPLIGIFD